MFGKLLKYDFLATGRIMAIVYAIFAAVSVYVIAPFYFNDIPAEEMGPMEALKVILLLVVVAALYIVTIVTIMVHFQKSLYSDQGYLTFTLPVKSFSILTSKVLVSSFWYLLASVSSMASIFIVIDALSKSLGEEGISLIEMILTLFDENLNVGALVFMLVCILVNGFASVFLYILEVCFAITISNTRPFQKHHVIFTLLFSAITVIVATTINSALADSILLGVSLNESGESLKFVTDIADANITCVNILPAVTSIAFAVGFFFVTHYVMKKKINLQ